MLADTDRWLRAAWFGDEPLRFAPADVWTDEFLDWDRRQDLARPRRLRPSAGWVAIRDGVAEGPLVGGCLETICRHLRGSPAWLDLRGALLFLETSEEVPAPERVDAYLAELAEAGVFDQIAGLVLGRPFGYDRQRTRRLWALAAGRTEARGLPVLGDVECGHTDPMLTIPLGVPGRLDATARTWRRSSPPSRPVRPVRPAGAVVLLPVPAVPALLGLQEGAQALVEVDRLAADQAHPLQPATGHVQLLGGAAGSPGATRPGPGPRCRWRRGPRGRSARPWAAAPGPGRPGAVANRRAVGLGVGVAAADRGLDGVQGGSRPSRARPAITG